MFDILPSELKSLAVRSKVRYAPHPYVWMAPARSKTTGLGLLTENKELPLSELPEWSEDKLKALPMVYLSLLLQTVTDKRFAIALEEPSYGAFALSSPSFWRCRNRNRPAP